MELLHLAFYAGSWSAFQTVPGTGAASATFPVSITRGAYGSAVVEIVYLDASSGSAVQIGRRFSAFAA